jgi:hypothetical protein
MSRAYGTDTGTVQINCPRDCGGALEVEVEYEWDTTVNWVGVNATGQPVDVDCGCPLTPAELAEVVKLAEDSVADDPGQLDQDWRI